MQKKHTQKNSFVSDSPIGKIQITMNGDFVVTLQFVSSRTKATRKLPSFLVNYFNKTESAYVFEFPEGTDFQKSVWNALLEIPYGETRVYEDIAKVVGRPKAVRAVGTAIGKNPLLIIIPCHRVVGKSGLGGYAGGVKIKQQLLALESVK